MSLIKHVLIFGGNGALGSCLIEHFKKQNYGVASIDISMNYKADFCILLENQDIMRMDRQETKIRRILDQDHPGLKYEAIICCAGGFRCDNAKDPNFLLYSEVMGTQNVNPSFVAASIAGSYLKEGGLLLLTGAKVALEPTPTMISYGVSKAAVHQLTKSLAAPGSGLPKGCKVLALLPATLDTPANRKAMPDADFTTWTPLDYITNLVSSWINLDNAPKSGALVCLTTKNKETKQDIK